MSFNDVENSNHGGRPVYMYSFTLGDTVWRYSSGDEDITASGHTWTAIAISDDGINLTGEAATDALKIRCPSDIGPVQVFIGTPPSVTIMVNVWHLHEGDGEVVLCYAGELGDVDFPFPGESTLTCHTLGATMQRDGLRFGWQRSCPYAVYDEMSCRVDKRAFGLNGLIKTAVSGVVTADGFGDKPNGYLSGGFIEWDHPIRGREYRGIEEHVGDTITMFGLSDGLYPGLIVTAYPGCNRTSSTCANRFNNLLNYGGIPHMPGKSPFDGDPVF